MFTAMKASCLLLYGLAIAAYCGQWPGAVGNAMQMLALVSLVVHVIEMLTVFDKVRLYKGPLAVSVVLTLLFGLLHWMPLAKQSKNNKQQPDVGA